MGKYVDMKGKTQIRTKAFDGVFAWSPTAEPQWDGIRGRYLCRCACGQQ